jgi:hypothetical protein
MCHAAMGIFRLCGAYMYAHTIQVTWPTNQKGGVKRGIKRHERMNTNYLHAYIHTYIHT